MANNDGNKISSLPPATVMSGTEEFVFAKGGGNGKVSFSDLLSNIPAATTEAAGLMSSLDKEKVNTLSTDTLGTNVKIGEETKIGTGVHIDNMVQIKSFIDGNNKKVLILGTDKDASGVSIEKIGNFGVKIGSATLGGNSGYECYLGSGAYVGDSASLGTGTVIDEGVRIGTDYGVTVDSSNIGIGISVFIDRNVSIGAGAQIGGIDISPSTTGLGTAVGIGNEVRIGNGVRLFNVVKDNATYHTFGKSIIGDNAKVYGVVGTDTTIGTEVGIGNGVKIDDEVQITKDGVSGFYLGTENHNVYLDKGDEHSVKIGSATIGHDVSIGNNVSIGHDVSIQKNGGGFQFFTTASLGYQTSIGYGLDIEKDGDDICFMKRMPDQPDITLKSGSYLGVGARVEDRVQVGTNVTVDYTNPMNEIVLGEAYAYHIGTSVVQQASGIKIGEDIRIGRNVRIGDPDTLLGWTGVDIGDGVNIGYGVDIEKDGYDILFMRRMPDQPDITLKSGSYLGGGIYEDAIIGTGVVIKKTDGNNFSIGRSYLGDNSYLGESSKMWRDVEIGTAVKIVGVNITGYGDRVVISNGEGKTITLNWDN